MNQKLLAIAYVPWGCDPSPSIVSVILERKMLREAPTSATDRRSIESRNELITGMRLYRSEKFAVVTCPQVLNDFAVSYKGIDVLSSGCYAVDIGEPSLCSTSARLMSCQSW